MREEVRVGSRPVSDGGSLMQGGQGDARAVLQELRHLHRMPVDREGYWQRFSACLQVLCRARAGVVVRRADTAGWVPLGCTPPEAEERLLESWQRLSGELAERVVKNGFAISPQSELGGGVHVGVALVGGADDTLLLLDIPGRERARLNELILRARLVADLQEAPVVASPASAACTATAASETVSCGDACLPADTGERRVGFCDAPAASDSTALLLLLDMMARVMEEQRFGAAALALVNGLAAHTGGALVALGWLQGGYVQAQAISHLDRFERKTEKVQLLETALEEALDQETPLLYPDDGEDPRVVLLAHARFAQALGLDRIVTIPLQRGTDSPEAVLLLDHGDREVSPTWLRQLTIVLQLLLPWLADLRARDRWFGARLASWSADRAASLVGPEHVGRKLLAVIAAGLLFYALIGTWPYRIDATADLVTDSTRLISAPFDGYLDKVAVTVGDEVKKGAVLATLDVQQFYLQESEIRADLRRFEAEADQARAQGEPVEVEIADARRAEAEARLKKVLFFLHQARIIAPFSGVVVDGERNELLGAPEKKGEKIFRLARIEGLYVQLYVPERDIRYVDPSGGKGELALLSQPDHEIPVQLQTLVPVARVHGEEGNQFMIKARFLQKPEKWWRPGMSGVVRIDAGHKRIAWILTHRLLDALRIKLWW